MVAQNKKKNSNEAFVNLELATSENLKTIQEAAA